MVYKIKVSLGNRRMLSRESYKTKAKAEQNAKRWTERYTDTSLQIPKAYKKVMKTSKVPKFSVVKK